MRNVKQTHGRPTTKNELCVDCNGGEVWFHIMCVGINKLRYSTKTETTKSFVCCENSYVLAKWIFEGAIHKLKMQMQQVVEETKKSATRPKVASHEHQQTASGL